MQNLAGKEDCDRYIRDELRRCRIGIVEGPRSSNEVAASVTGKLGEFTFWRAWYYWVVSGKLPLAVARELYTDPVGRTDIRVDGHCGRPAPEDPWIRRYDSSGKSVHLDSDGEQRKRYQYLIAEELLTQEKFDQIRWAKTAEERESVTENAYVEQYHIDTEVGLRLFADTVRHHYGLPLETT